MKRPSQSHGLCWLFAAGLTVVSPAAVLAAPHTPTQGYTATVLRLDPDPGTPDTPAATFGQALNNNGQIVGSISQTNNRGFVWSPGDGMRLLSDVFRTPLSPFGADIADDGTIVGSYTDGTPGGLFFAFQGNTTGVFQQLSPGVPHIVAGATAVSSNGVIVGGMATFETGGFRATRWSQGGELDLGTLGGGDFSLATGINAGGLITGISRPAGANQDRAFRWTESGGMEELGLPSGMTLTESTAISDSGLIVGRAASPSLSLAVAWGADGSVIPLPMLSPTSFFAKANAVNTHDQIVGNGLLDGDLAAVIWHEQQAFDLRDHVIGLPDGINMHEAMDINDNGQILIQAFDSVNVEFVTVVLTPVPAPAGTLVFGAGAALLLRRRRLGPVFVAAGVVAAASQALAGSAQPPEFNATVIRVELPPGGPGSVQHTYGLSLNNHGELTGSFDSGHTGFIWSPLEGVRLLSDIFSTTDPVVAQRITDGGALVGRRIQAGAFHPFVGATDGSFATLPGTQPHSFNGATSIRGEFVVGSGATQPSGAEQALIWRNGVLTDIGSASGFFASFASDVNASGVAVGNYYPNHTDPSLPFRWSETSGPETLAMPAGAGTGYVAAIRDDGIMVGATASISLPTSRATLWHSDGSFEELPSPFGGLISAEALAINSSMQIVGRETAPTRQSFAMLWYDGQPFVLDDLTLDLPSGISLVRGLSINESGQILANGFDFSNGMSVAVLLTPVPAPGTIGVLSAAAVFACRRRRGRMSGASLWTA